MKGGLSARGLANVAVRNWSNDFTFIIGDHRYLCPSSVAQFLSPRVSELHWMDATISELRLEVDNPDELFGSVLEAAGCGSIKVDSAHQPTFLGICATLWNSEVYRSFSPAHGDEKAMENVADSLRFLSATRCDISPELEFIASHFDDFLRRRDGLKAFSFSMIYEILGQGSLRLESKDSLCRFISESMRTRPEMYGLIEFVRLEYCSTDVITNFFARLSEHFYEINVSMWASLRARLVLPNINKRQAKQFPPSVKKVMIRSIEGFGEITIDVPDGIVAHLTRECGGNVHDHHVVDVTSGSFERETHGLNPHSGAYGNHPSYAAMNAADLATDSYFQSAYRQKEEEIPHTRNNWVCYGFKERKIVATHYAIRTYWGEPRDWHLRSWLVKTSVNGKSWREVDRQEPNDQLNSPKFTGTFAVAGGGECRFIRLVNIGRNHGGYDGLVISAWDIFGSVIE
jgi:hypothetical protein